jgi:hypothetical protein
MTSSLARITLALAIPLALSAQAAAAQEAAGSGGVVPLPPTTLPLKHAPQPTTSAITAADLMTRLYIFSDDSMQGREAGTEGNVKGTDYIASEIKRMGLKPAGDNGTYFQTIPLKTRSVDESSSITAGGNTLVANTDFVVLSRQASSASNVPVVYGGDLGDSSHISDDDAKGKFVVFTAQGGWTRFLRAARRGMGMPGATAIAVATLDSVPEAIRGFLTRPQTFLDEGTQTQQPGPAVFFVTEAAAAKLLGAAPNGLTVGSAHGTATLDVKLTTKPSAFPARNVVGIVPGSDAKLRGEYVAIGAHNDHIGMTRPVDHDSIRIWNHTVRPEGADDGGKEATPAEQSVVDQELAAYRAAHPNSQRVDSIDNGADDDGSGTVSALEMAQYFSSMKTKPKRSLLFVWHVGEEKGLLGSRYFTDNPTVPRDSVVTQLNMDMVGRGDAYDETGRTKDGASIHGSNGYLQLVGSRRLSTELGDLIEKVNKDGHHDLTLDYSIDADGHPANIYCRSDHYEYARYGIPITFFTTGLHSDYHQVTDEPEYIDYDHMAKVVDFVADIALHVANLDHRPVVDHPKPDPNGTCRQ